MTDTTAAHAPLSADSHEKTPGNHRLGWALVLISIAQLMVVLDGTIVNIALPFIQQDLDIASAEPPVGRHRLRAGLRQPAAARWPPRRPLRAPQGLHDRPGRLRRRLAARRPRHQRGAAARGAGPAGSRRGAGLTGRPRADHHDVPRWPDAQPRLRDLRRHVGRGRGGGPAARWLADRPRQRLRPRRGGLAPHPADQHPDRHHHGPARAALPRRVRVAPGPARPPRRRHRHLRPARPRLRPQPRGHRRLDRHLDDHQPRRRHHAARRLPGDREPGQAPAPADPSLREPHPGGQLRGDVLRASGDVRDVLLPQPVHPDGDGLQPDPGRRRVPAVLLRTGGGRRASPPAW